MLVVSGGRLHHGWWVGQPEVAAALASLSSLPLLHASLRTSPSLPPGSSRQQAEGPLHTCRQAPYCRRCLLEDSSCAVMMPTAPPAWEAMIGSTWGR